MNIYIILTVWLDTHALAAARSPSHAPAAQDTFRRLAPSRRTLAQPRRARLATLAIGGQTPVYAASEVRLEGLQPSEKADAYSFGIILSEVFTGSMARHVIPPDIHVAGRRPPVDIADLYNWCIGVDRHNRPRGSAGA